MVKCGLVQRKCVEDKEVNIKNAIDGINEAVEQGAKIISLQELFYGIYFPQTLSDKYFNMYTETIPGPTYEKMKALSGEKDVALVIPIFEEAAPGVYYNTAMVFSQGEYLGKYRKTHIPHLAQYQEKYYFTPGDLGFPVFKTSWGKVGIAICYDRHFPEVFRELALGGAEVVFVPTATAGWTSYLWDLEIRGHSVANMFFVGGLNRVGQEAEMPFYGSSYFANPRGEVVGRQCSNEEDDVLVEELDLNQIREVRNTWLFFRDRRVDQYNKIMATPEFD